MSKNYTTFISNLTNPTSPFISILIGTTSFIAIAVAYLTLKEMQTQRELSLMPIVLSKTNEEHHVYIGYDCPQNLMSIRFYNDKSDRDSVQARRSTFFLEQEFINAGIASAVNLEYEWNINYEWYKEVFDSLQVDSMPLSIELDPNIVNIRHKGCNSSLMNLSSRTNNQKSYSHILPTSYDKNGLTISFPLIALDLALNSMKLNWAKNGINQQNVWGTTFEHGLTISYESVSGTEFNTNYIAKLHIRPRNAGSTNNVYSCTEDEFYIYLELTPIDPK